MEAAKFPLTLRVWLKVEDAKTKIPAVVEVGVSVGCPGKAMCQAPGEPALVQEEPVTDKSPAEEAWIQLVDPEERLSKVTAPVAVRAPLRRVDPKTPRVVVGKAVPMPTLFSLALMTKVLDSASKIAPP